ncbi:ribonuclease H-like domain-containing protein [Tanacetum coccineum]|uniref:Ribonuclease H-like domain-containing protein n=1 Tax=Tanacetum coccineum TaxID=301880 RepID=A0ABQ4YT16_9ASTR
MKKKLDEEDSLAREKAQQVEVANIAWDDIQAKIDADYQLAERLQAQEQQELTIEEKSTLTELVEGPKIEESSKKAEVMEESSSKRAGDEIEQENVKKKKVDDDQESAKMKELMKIVPDEEEVAVDAIPFATKPPSIVDWKIVKEGKISYYQIIRADGNSKRPEEGYERVLWGDLNTMFEHHVEDAVWRNLRENKVLVWKLFDFCGVHFVRFQNLHVFMLVEKRYPLTPAIITEMPNKKLQADHWNEMIVGIKRLLDDLRVTAAQGISNKASYKTPYELFLGRKPALVFMRPFGCPVTNLNTIDHLGKFDSKADEGFFVGYSINSKAFRVFNSRTRIVEENLHVQFSENTLNISGSGPNWLFDIDALTKSMKYKLIIVGNQSNSNAGTKECDDAGKARMETVPGKDYIMLPLWKKGGDSSNDQEKEDSVNSTNNVNVAITNEVNFVGAKTSIELLDEFNMLELISFRCYMSNMRVLHYEDEIPSRLSIPCDSKEEGDSDDEDLDIYEPRVCYDEKDRIYTEAMIFVNKRLVRLMDVTVEQWLNLIYGDHNKVDVKKQWVTRGIDADMEYDPSDVEFAEWLALKFYNHKTMDRYVKNALWIYWTRRDDEVKLTDEEFSDPNDENLINKDEVAEIFRIETIIFEFETPLYKALDEFNYLLKIDTDLLTSDILGFKTYDEFKNEWMDE